MVVIEPFSTPNFWCTTFTTGPRQLVVQLAFEMMLCLAGSYAALLTPRTSVTSSFLAGAEIMTFLTEPLMCLEASLPSVKKPVDSMTISAPTLVQSSSAGSLVLKTLMVLPATVIESASWVTVSGKTPSTESYRSEERRGGKE